ncbi:MAG TPA: ADOP family duplicated permease [Bryobacteraceae bacterium]|nr:ADOP family duplicated permease [Bryobacteraceae bacterium]
MPANADTFLRDLRHAARSLARAKGLTISVILTLALGIGANTAMFSLVRGVLLRPLVNRDESRLIYIHQNQDGENVVFSVPEIQDIRSRMKTLTSFGDFSVVGFTLNGLGDPRSVRAGVVGGSYFQTMGLRPVLGRLLNESDDGPKAAGAVVLTYRFWATSLNRDPAVLGKTVRLGSFVDTRSAQVVGVLEPCVPYPQDTEIIANIVTSAHHLSATMVTGRIHRMTDLFARLAPGSDLPQARAELESVYQAMKHDHPEAYPSRSNFTIGASLLRDQLTSDARTILLVLMAASILVFVIACSNVANLILARTVRRANELSVRASLGATALDLRRVLLAESLLLSAAGAILGVLAAGPLVDILSRYASRFSVRAVDLTVDPAMLWLGAGLAVLAAALLAFVPRLPSSQGDHGYSLAGGSPRVTGAANRKLKVFAVVQVAACFVLVAASAATVKTLLSLQAARSSFETRQVLAVDVPVLHEQRTPVQIVNYYREIARQVQALPGVLGVAVTDVVPLRDRTYAMEFAVDGHHPASGEISPRASLQVISPHLFATLGLPVIEGRDFNDADREGSENVAIVSQSLADKMFPGRSALGHYLTWTDPLFQFFPGFNAVSRRIVGIVPDIDPNDIVARPTVTIYHPFDQDRTSVGGRLLVHVSTDPYALVQPITRIIRALYADQPVERARTLADIRTEVLSNERVNAVVSGIFAAVALLIAIVGVAGVLLFSVSGRTREFGIRLAVGSAPRHLLLRVVTEGAVMALAGVALGLAAGYGLGRVAGSFLGDLKMPGPLVIVGSSAILLIAAVTASALPALRASRTDVIQALRSE